MKRSKDKFEPRYSGKSKLSVDFWKRVSAVPWAPDGQTIYTMGCALQDLEGRVVTLLNNAENKRKRA